MRKLALLAAATFAVAGLSSVASATAPVPVNLNNCTGSLTLPTPDAIQCNGYYSGNILDNSSNDTAAQMAAVAALGGSFDGDFDALSLSGNVITSLSNTNQLDFGQTLFGQVIIGAHFGNITDPFANPNNNGQTGNVSVFWLFNFTTPTQFVTLDNVQGFSNAALYQTGDPRLPEPSTWAMMLLGFGAMGIAIRRSRKKTLVSQFA
jgi:hypothetical protein